MNNIRPNYLRYTLDNGSGVISFNSHGKLLAHAAESLRRNEAKTAKGFAAHLNLRDEVIVCPVDMRNSNTGLPSFDKLIAAGGNLMHGNATTDTQYSHLLNAYEWTSWDAQVWKAIMKDAPPWLKSKWMAQLDVVDGAALAPANYVITRVLAKNLDSDEDSVNHGWILSTNDGKYLDSECAHAHPASGAILAFYKSALCYGDWPVKELLVDLKNGTLESVHPDVRALADALPEPYLWEEHQQESSYEALTPGVTA
jgi:hypothetical protein